MFLTDLESISIVVLGHATSKLDAINLINRAQPQIIFLDIILDEGTGFDVLSQASLGQSKVIFVSAHEEFALKAIKYNALDYILKPIGIDELTNAVEKATADIEREKYTNQMQIEMLSKSVTMTKSNSSRFHFICRWNRDEFDFVMVTTVLFKDLLVFYEL